MLFVFAAMTLTLGTVYAVLLMDTADFTADILVVLVTLVTVTATLRRLHDRSLSHRLALILVVTPVVLSIVSIFVFGADALDDIDRAMRDMLEAMLENKPDNAPYGFIAAYGGVVLLQTIFALITFILCLLPSKLGDNQHGPNPHEVPS